ncbi:hypothetical protein ACFYY8_13115 [Streptosporangium sp. NPDC001559]|uniref:hypothetical protein n=1 Tax=Streptosporangium sp. NPDC001559 TaxID=3366187 RepID=UPI0036E116C4
MANMVTACTDTVQVSNRTFLVIDEEVLLGEAAADAVAPWDHVAVEGWFAPAGNGARVTVDTRDQVVDVRFELWDGPSPPSETWTKEWRGELSLYSGKVCLTDWRENFPPLVVFDLGRRQARWGVHACMRQLREPTKSDPQITSYDLEFYLVRFWPEG